MRKSCCNNQLQLEPGRCMWRTGKCRAMPLNNITQVASKWHATLLPRGPHRSCPTSRKKLEKTKISDRSSTRRDSIQCSDYFKSSGESSAASQSASTCISPSRSASACASQLNSKMIFIYFVDTFGATGILVTLQSKYKYCVYAPVASRDFWLAFIAA